MCMINYSQGLCCKKRSRAEREIALRRPGLGEGMILRCSPSQPRCELGLLQSGAGRGRGDTALPAGGVQSDLALAGRGDLAVPSRRLQSDGGDLASIFGGLSLVGNMQPQGLLVSSKARSAGAWL